MRPETTITELSKAMAAAFPMIEKAVKNRVNPHFKSAYADLGSVISAVKPALVANGLWFTQNVHPTPGFATVETIIFHQSGESVSCGLTSVPVQKNDCQGYGSSLSYARRYSLSSAFGVETEDDDGNVACEVNKSSTSESRKSSTSEVSKSPTLELRKPPSSERRKLVNQELMELGSKVRECFDEELDIAYNDADVSEFLKNWQDKGDISVAVSLLATDRPRLAHIFKQWIDKKVA